MNAWWERFVAWYWWIWTGYRSEAEVRRYLECEVHRFGRAVTWLPKSRR